jgi:hypothetical protein
LKTRSFTTITKWSLFVPENIPFRPFCTITGNGDYLKSDLVVRRDMQSLNYLRIAVLLKHSKWLIEFRVRCSLELSWILKSRRACQLTWNDKWRIFSVRAVFWDTELHFSDE